MHRRFLMVLFTLSLCLTFLLVRPGATPAVQASQVGLTPQLAARQAPAAPPVCPVGLTPTLVYSTTFEAGAAGWDANGAGSIASTWALTDARTTSGSNAFFAVDPPTLSDQRLVSPPIALPTDGVSLTLAFNTYQAFETPNTDGRCWDAAILEISTDSGMNWTQISDTLLLTDPYDAVIWNDQPGNNPLGPTRAWCPNPPPQDWLTSVVDLDSFEGQSAQFRFRFGSDSAAGNEGWYIDDVQVQTCEPPLAVGMSGFSAVAEAGRVRLVWETTSEVNNVGFNLFRSRNAADAGQQVNAALISSEAPGGAEGASYEWADTAVEAGQTYYYWLEAVDTAGGTQRFGPASATVQAPTAIALGELGSRAGSPVGWAEVAVGLVGLSILAGVWRRRIR